MTMFGSNAKFVTFFSQSHLFHSQRLRAVI